MSPSVTIWLLLVGLSATLADTLPENSSSGSQPQVQAQPAYPGQPQDPVATYASAYNVAQSSPAVSYGYEAGYGVQNPSMYDYMIASTYPNIKTTQEVSDPVRSVSIWVPIIRQAFGVVLKLISKLGFMVLGGAGLILMGIAATSAICALTPVCTLTFFGGQSVTQDTVRALLAPDKITATAEFVQHAIDKYQQLQRVVN